MLCPRRNNNTRRPPSSCLPAFHACPPFPLPISRLAHLFAAHAQRKALDTLGAPRVHRSTGRRDKLATGPLRNLLLPRKGGLIQWRKYKPPPENTQRELGTGHGPGERRARGRRRAATTAQQKGARSLETIKKKKETHAAAFTRPSSPGAWRRASTPGTGCWGTSSTR